ncbi:hypothetical protein K6R49_003728 [Escherichia coli]|uniref:hypothetical protein n=1 Tax=Buttiauxella noackiae TaxID=82992 RepID=UPI0019DFD20F|nr:hypothetical protein [Escherichia coli]MBJ0329696.1 hypothetical protein [Escherichia coli]
MSPIPDEDNIIFHVVSHPNNRETLQYLESMPFEDFMRYRTMLDIRDAFEAERECKRAIEEEAAARSRKPLGT